MNNVHIRPRIFPTILVVMMWLLSGAACTQADAPADPLAELEKIARAYKIEIVVNNPQFPVKTTHGVIDGKSADNKKLATYAALFAPEFQLYPPDLIRRAKVKRFVLCEELAFARGRRGAIPDWDHDTMYYDVASGAYNTTYQRKVFHHEFYHMIDFRDDGSVYRDDRWAALNPPGFKYGNGGVSAQNTATTSILTDKYPGFLNHYSTTGVEEDKAEMFANLIVDSAYVMGRAEKDRVLKAKVTRMKELMAIFCPDVKEEFWEKAAKLKRGEERPAKE